MKKILIVKVGAFGDVVMSLFMLEALKQCYPEATIDWICGKKVAPFLSSLDKIDRLITVDEEALLRGKKLQQMCQVLRSISHLGIQRYDLAIVAHRDSRYRLLLGGARCREVRWMGDETRYAFSKGLYHGLAYQRVVESSYRKLIFPHFEVSKWPLERDREAPIVLAPGGNPKVEPGKQFRMWPLISYRCLAEKLIEAGWTVAIVGSKTDGWMSPSFSTLNVIDLIGKTTELELLSLFQSAGCVVTHDSGPMHLAAIAKVPLVALFGPTTPSEKLPPQAPWIHCLWGGNTLSCRPCYDGKNYAVCSLPRCMHSISVDQVFETILNHHSLVS